MRPMPTVGADLPRVAAAPGDIGAKPGGAAIDYVARYGGVAHYKGDEANGNLIAALGGLNLTQHGACAAGAGKIGGAREVNNPSANYFDHADDPLFRIGAFDFALAWWGAINAGEFGSARALISKDGLTAGYHSRLQADGTPIWIVRQAGGADYGRIASTTVLTATVFHFFFVYIDATAPEVGISIDGGAFATAAGTGTPGPGAAAFSVGNLNDPGCRMFVDELSVFKPTGIGGLKTEMRDRLWNGGAGRGYPWS